MIDVEVSAAWKFFLLVLIASALVFSSSAQLFDEPAPELQNISVYDVTDVSNEDRYTGGKLVDSGLNKTFVVNQTEDMKDYRFTFRVENTGGADWTLESGDELFHEGVDSGWNINRTWYNISGTEYEGGDFSSGTVSWQTGNGGTLQVEDNMYAKYIVEVDLPSSQELDQRFVANDTSEVNGTEDEHVLDINRLGFLDVVLEEPPEDTVLTEYKTFQMNATIQCSEGECGNVSVTPRYNQSSVADTLIPESSGEPFYTVDSSQKYCDFKLFAGDECSILWSVNATGPVGSNHLLDSNASSSYSLISGNESQDSAVQIQNVVMINLSWSSTDFGTLDPGGSEKPAIGNDNLTYNVTVQDNSNDADIWIKGADLVSLEDSSYEIGIGNLTYDTENLYSTDSPDLSRSYELLKSSVSENSVLNTFYWLDIPTGIVSGGYEGSITFKANLSEG